MDNELKLNITTENDKVIILTGEAPKHIEPKVINIQGNLLAPSEYLETNELDKKDCYVLVDMDNCSLELVIGKNNHYQDKIKGVMKKSSLLTALGINTTTQRSSKELAKILKSYRDFIDPKDFGLIGKLMTFEAKVNTVIEDSSAQSGNTKKLLEKTVQTGLPESFVMTLPIYQGFEMQTINVELWAEATSNTVVFSLESMDLISVETKLKESVIKKQIEIFKNFGCPVIIL